MAASIASFNCASFSTMIENQASHNNGASQTQPTNSEHGPKKQPVSARTNYDFGDAAPGLQPRRPNILARQNEHDENRLIGNVPRDEKDEHRNPPPRNLGIRKQLPLEVDAAPGDKARLAARAPP